MQHWMIDRRHLWKADWSNVLRLAKHMGLPIPRSRTNRDKVDLIERMAREMVRLEMMDAAQRRMK